MTLFREIAVCLLVACAPGVAGFANSEAGPSEFASMFQGPEWIQTPSLRPEFMSGHVFMDYYNTELFEECLDPTLNSMCATGAKWAIYCNFWTYTSLDPPRFARSEQEDPRGFRDATETEIATMIDETHARGMKFALTLELSWIGLIGEWRGWNHSDRVISSSLGFLDRTCSAAQNRTNSSDAFEYWDQWFAAFEEPALYHAQVAEACGADMLVIGQSMWGAVCPGNEERWRTLIARVREVYSGPIGYAAVLEDYGDSESLMFPCDALDYLVVVHWLHISTYPDPSIAELRRGFEHLNDTEFEPLSRRFGTPIIFMTTFQSCDHAALQTWFEPGMPSPDIRMDLHIQARMYEAFLQSVADEDWVAGSWTVGYWWRDDFNTTYSPGDSSYDKSPSVRGKPASCILQNWWLDDYTTEDLLACVAHCKAVEAGNAEAQDSVSTGAAAPYRVHGTAILFDEAHQERNTLLPERAEQLNPERPDNHLFKRLAEDLSVELQLDRGVTELSRDLLVGYRVLVISAPKQAFTEAEIREVEAFVRGGGGLLVLGDSHIGPEISELTEPFDITFLSQDVISSASGGRKPQNVPAGFFARDHAVTQGVVDFSTDWGTAIDSYGDATVLLRTDADSWHDTANEGVRDPGESGGPFVLGVALEYGSGRVVALSDNNFLDHAWDTLSGNKTLLMNAIEWLSEGSRRLVIDDFEDGDMTTAIGLEWGGFAWGGGSLGSPMRIERSQDGASLLLDMAGEVGIGAHSRLGEIDCSAYDGVYVILSVPTTMEIGLNLLSTDDEWPSGERDTYSSQVVGAAGALATLRIPFTNFVVEPSKRNACPECEIDLDPSRIFHIGIEAFESSGELRIHEVGFYREDATIADTSDESVERPSQATPGVDGYAVILEVNDYPEEFTDLTVDYMNRDRIVDALASCGWSEENMYIALDDEVAANAVANAMDWLLERATEEDLVFVYVAAHYSYLKQVVEFDRIFPPLWRLVSTDRKVLVVDACKAGELTVGAMHGTFVASEDFDISEVSPSPGLSISACAHDEVAMWGTVEEGLPIVGGLMTYYLHEALLDRSLDTNGDTYVSVEEAFVGLYPRTRAYYRETAPRALEDPDLPEAVRQQILNDLDVDGFPHPEMIDAFPGELILDLRYYGEAAEDGI
ncbi:caspase family protein [Candidatus Bipolaricaulota bacterium]|nr:caspase family protein [Candidatus Bipolaricaulota bacterium]